MNPLLESLAKLLLYYFAFFLFYRFILIPILDKLYELGVFRKSTFNKEWDAKVHNWLTEDNLNIKLPDYFVNGGTLLRLIDTPLGLIWVGDDLFGSEASFGKGILTPSLETKQKLKKRIEDLGLKYNTKKSGFERI